MAKIVVYRPKVKLGHGLKPPVIYDGFLVSYLPNGSYVALQTPPGQHTIQSNREGSRIFAEHHNVLTLDAKEGETSYIRLKIVMGAWEGLGEVQPVTPEEGKAEAASLVQVEPNWEASGKPWLDEHPEPPAMNVDGAWRGGKWNKIVLAQAEHGGALHGKADGWDVQGVVSGNHVYLLFSSYGDVAYSAVLTAAGGNELKGSYVRGLMKEEGQGKPMDMTR